MNQARVETSPPQNKPKPTVTDEPEKPKFTRRTEESPISAGIYTSITTLTNAIENGARLEVGETNTQLVLKTWVSEILQKNYLPYLGDKTIGALFFRIERIDASAAHKIVEPTWQESLWGKKRTVTPQRTQVPGGKWQSSDVFLALRLPTIQTETENRVGLIQAGIIEQKNGQKIVDMLMQGPYIQQMAEIINLLNGFKSFGPSGDVASLRDISTLTLPDKLSGQQLAKPESLQILPNAAFGSRITTLPKVHYFRLLGNF